MMSIAPTGPIEHAPAAATPASDPAAAAHRNARRAHWDAVARAEDRWSGFGRAYHRRLEAVYRFVIAPGQRVLEIGCGRGDLLAAVAPSVGVGVDFSPEMIARASSAHPQLTFIEADAHDLSAVEGPFDAVILSDLVNDLWDVQVVFDQVRRVSTPRTRIVVNAYSRLWELPLAMVRALGLARPTLFQNWLTVSDLDDLLRLSRCEIVRRWEEILWPAPTPFVASLFNRWIVKTWPARYFALTNFIVARSSPEPTPPQLAPTVSVVVAARNEAGNIANIFARTPKMGGGTELIFVEGHSTDGTYETIERECRAHPDWRSKYFRQTGKGKGDAVRLGFSQASGDIVMILDADLTVPPEDLPRFYEALRSGAGEYINGVRLVYPMEDEAMRFFNLIANKGFSLAFSWLLGQPIKDTLCGTKALWKADYDIIARNRTSFGNFDPFGDFDLLFGSAKIGLKMIDLPVRYRARTYGTTNIQRWSHGWLLLRMVAFAAGRIKFV